MILITGCAGFIGFHLAQKLLIQKKKVIGIDNIDNYYLRSNKYQRLNIIKKYKNFKFLKADLNNYDKVNSLIKNYKIDLVIHLAAQPGVRISIKNPHNTL